MQTLLPIVPADGLIINRMLSVVKRTEGEKTIWTYFSGIGPVFEHDSDDLRSFKMYTSQLICSGQCRKVDIIKAFNVSKSLVGRAVKKYQGGGVAAFYEPPNVRGASVLTPDVLTRAQKLLDNGKSRREVSDHLELKYDTLKKAINDGRLHETDKIASNGSTKSQRSATDAKAEMGVGCTREAERVAAATGEIACAATKFESCRDVSFGGLLCTVPALVANGLFDSVKKHFRLQKGYYALIHVVLLMAYMWLCRIKSSEQLRYHSCGELGKLMGLDRVPEVRTLREKLSFICTDRQAIEDWRMELSESWMHQNKELSGVLYVDGHVKVYHGSQTPLPRRYISTRRLCLRGITDYWVNDMLGQPFFVVSRQIDRGLLEALRSDIVPKLLKDVPRQPSAQLLKEKPLLHRFILVFDREGYSPGFFRQMWDKHRIACITYRKYCTADWPESEFKEFDCEMPNGETIKMKLAERGVQIGNKKGEQIWVREVRKLTESGHQTSVISTAYSLPARQIAIYMFSRWSQENFFSYMKQHYNIDALTSYTLGEFPETKRVINPRWKHLDKKIRSENGKLARKKAELGDIEIDYRQQSGEIEKYMREKGELLEIIDQMSLEIKNLKQERKQHPKHVELSQLPEQHQIKMLDPKKKMFVDTIKMIAYRSETAMAMQIKKFLKKDSDARPLIRKLISTEVDIIPDASSGRLVVQVHRMNNPRSDRAAEHLLRLLNETDTIFPQTHLRLHYRMADLS